MADDVPITAGSGTNIATDDVAGSHYQRVKLTDGTADSSTVIAAGGGTEATALRVTVASDSTGVLSVDDNGSSLTVDLTAQATVGAAAPGSAVLVGGSQSGALRAINVSATGDVSTTLATSIPTGSAYIGKVRLTDGTNDITIDTVHGDAESNTENHQDVAAKIMGFNGTTWDRLRSDTTNGLDVDVTRVPAPLSTTGGGTEATALRVTVATDSTGVLSVDDNAASLSVDWNGTQPVTGSGTATGALRVELANNGTGVVGLNTGTNSIGNVGVVPRTSGGFTTYHLVSAGTTNATNVKASAGQLFGWYIYNSNASMRKVALHNTSGTPTAGASIFFTIPIPGMSAANVFTDAGIAFSSGIGITTVTDLTDAGSTAVAANDLNINLFYS